MAILASGIAAADTIRVTGLPTGEGSENQQDLWIDENGTDTDVYFAGNITIQVTAGTHTYTRVSMCVELFTDISLNTTYNTIIYVPNAFSPPTGNELLQIAWLLDNYDPEPGNALTDAQAAGLQLAIWKIAEDGVYTYVQGVDPFKSGQVQAIYSGSEETNTTVLSDAEAYLKDASGQSSDLAYVYYNTNQQNGDIVQMLEGPLYPTGPQGQTPESSTFVLAGVALLALGRMARRKLVSH
ncbi:MAG: hypothetical protein ACLQPN_18790 [Bryobacteraceae bacterium]